jgi:tetratricopeptide (TPR) repeat protein
MKCANAALKAAMNPQPPETRTTGRNADDYLQAARAAREAGQIAEARAQLETAAQHFPNSAAIRHDLARIVEAARDWTGAEHHWRVFLTLADRWWAFTSLANALREQGRLQDADAVLIGQFARLANEPNLFFEYALLAERAQDWPQAAKRWADATTRFPRLWDGHGGQARALRQRGDPAGARALLTAAANFPNLAQPFLDIAQLAEADQDWPAAEQAWRGFLARDNGEWWAHKALAHTLRRQRRFDAADAVLTDRLSRFPDEPGVLFEYAAIAEDRGDWAKAAERYRLVVHRHPDRPEAARGLAYMLARLGRRSEGDATLQQSIAINPGDLALRLAFARNAAEIGPEGASAFLDRAQQTLVDFPQEPEAHGFLADALAANALFDQAETCLAAACAHFPWHVDLLKRWATNLAQQSKWDDALTVFDRLDHVRPPDEQAECDRARTLIAAGRWNLAEARLTAAISRFPGSAMLQVLRLDLMIASNQLQLATAQWQEIERKFPRDASGLLFERRTRMLGFGNDPARTTQPDQHHLVMQFESLGGWGLGCEFGLVQRAMGAEPLGLLRWADIDTQGLIDALESAFEGVGQPNQTELETSGGALDEYVSKDRRFGIRLHTYVPSSQVTPKRMLAQTCRRLSFLRQKLLDDLHRADKILVYKNAKRPLSDSELERMRLAIRRYGNNTLLYVRYQTEEHRFPSVISPAPGLLIGHIDTMGLTPDGMPTPIPFKSWIAVAVNAHALWKASA